MGGAGGWGGSTTPSPSQEGTHHSSRCLREAAHCRGEWLSPTAGGVLQALAPLLNCSLPLPSLLISNQPSFHASFYPFFHALFPLFPLLLSPSFLPFYHSFPLMKSHREKLHFSKARVNLV